MIDRISAMTSRMAMTGALGPVRPLDTGAVPVPAIGPAGGTEGPSFGDTLKQFVGDVSGLEAESSDMKGRFLRGENVELHAVMAKGEEAGIALDLMVELRNKVTEAYRTLVSMQS